MRWPLIRSGFRGRKRWSVRKPFVFGGLGGDRGGGCENRGAVLCGQGDAPKAIDVEIQQGHCRRNLEQLAAAFFVSVTPTCTQLPYTPNNKIQAVSICRSTPHCSQSRGQDDFRMEGRRTEGKVVAAGTPQLQTDYTEASTFTGNGGSWPLFESTTRSRCAVGLFLGSDDAGGRGSSDPSFAPYSDSEWYEP
jgi:hypothetical protein